MGTQNARPPLNGGRAKRKDPPAATAKRLLKSLVTTKHRARAARPEGPACWRCGRAARKSRLHYSLFNILIIDRSGRRVNRAAASLQTFYIWGAGFSSGAASPTAPKAHTAPHRPTRARAPASARSAGAVGAHHEAGQRAGEGKAGAHKKRRAAGEEHPAAAAPAGHIGHLGLGGDEQQRRQRRQAAKLASTRAMPVGQGPKRLMVSR